MSRLCMVLGQAETIYINDTVLPSSEDPIRCRELIDCDKAEILEEL